MYHNGLFTPWRDIWLGAEEVATSLPADKSYLIDSGGASAAVSALVACLAAPGIRMIWGTPCASLEATATRLKAIYEIPAVIAPEVFGGRALYGTFTSGSSGEPKIPMGDVLGLLASAELHEKAIYTALLPAPRQGGALATCLRPDYVAPFLMALLPGLQSGRNVHFLDPGNFKPLFDHLQQEPVVLISVPALLSALSAYAAGCGGLEADGLTVVCTGGHLSAPRIEHASRHLRHVRFGAVYGSTEAGTVSFNGNPASDRHVGYPLRGKDVWIASPDASGSGRIVTAGFESRLFYAYTGVPLVDASLVLQGTDRGHWDPEGRLVLDGRIDGSAKLHGILVRTVEIEHHILRLPGVVDARVFVRTLSGSASDRLEATVIGDVTEQALRQHCWELAASHRPTNYAIHADELGSYSRRGKLS